MKPLLALAIVVVTAACSAPAPPAAEAKGAPTGAPTEAQIAASTLVDAFGKPHLSPAPLAISVDAQRVPVVFGSLTQQQIVDVIRAQRAHVTNCANASPTDPAQGLVVVKLVIGGDGRVTQAQAIESSMGRPGVEECIVGAAKTWSFPEPKGGGIAIATYPFRLE